MNLHDTKNVSKGKARNFNSCPPKGKIRNVLLAKHGFYRLSTQYHCFQLLFHVCSCIILVSVKIPLKLHHNRRAGTKCYLWEWFFIWAGEIILVKVLGIEHRGPWMLRRWHRQDFGFLFIFPFGSNCLHLLRLWRRKGNENMFILQSV